MNTLSQPHRRVTATEYQKMAEQGRLPADRVELIRGEIRVLPQMEPAHVGRMIRLTKLLITAVGDNAWVAPRIPLTLPRDDASEPLPDLMLLRPHECDDHYDHEMLTAANVLLVLEISDSARNEQDKVALYAENSVPEVWILDLQDNALSVFHT